MFHRRAGRARLVWYGVWLLWQNERSARHVSSKAYYWEAPLIGGNWRDDGPVQWEGEGRRENVLIKRLTNPSRLSHYQL